VSLSTTITADERAEPGDFKLSLKQVPPMPLGASNGSAIGTDSAWSAASAPDHSLTKLYVDTKVDYETLHV
jgi:hypothetical protein